MKLLFSASLSYWLFFYSGDSFTKHNDFCNEFSLHFLLRFRRFLSRDSPWKFIQIWLRIAQNLLLFTHGTNGKARLDAFKSHAKLKRSERGNDRLRRAEFRMKPIFWMKTNNFCADMRMRATELGWKWWRKTFKIHKMWKKLTIFKNRSWLVKDLKICYMKDLFLTLSRTKSFRKLLQNFWSSELFINF